MKIDVINPITYPQWNSKIAALPGISIFHTSNWATVLSSTYGYIPKYFCTFINGEIANLIPIMEIISPVTGKRGVSLPFSDRVVPIVQDKLIFEEMISFALAYGRKRGWKTLTLHDPNGLLREKDAYISYYSPYIEMNCSKTELFKRFRSSTRRNIRKAQKCGVEINICNTKKALLDFQKLNCHARKDHGLPPQPSNFFDNIYSHILCDNMGFVNIATYKGEVIAGAVFFSQYGQTIYKYGASKKKLLHLRPNNLVLSTAISHSVGQGAKVFDLGRTDYDFKGLLQYKMGWGAKKSTTRYFKIDISSGKFLVKKPFLKPSYTLFKILPLSILQIIGKLVYKHIG